MKTRGHLLYQASISASPFVLPPMLVGCAVPTSRLTREEIAALPVMRIDIFFAGKGGAFLQYAEILAAPLKAKGSRTLP
jgi:hypothetical protein